jgi:hypothetical protein
MREGHGDVVLPSLGLCPNLLEVNEQLCFEDLRGIREGPVCVRNTLVAVAADYVVDERRLVDSLF